MTDPSLEIDVQQVQQLLTTGDIVLVDCREPEEYETARIDGSILMPMSQWARVSGSLAEYDGKHLVVHCHHGGRSLRVTQWLRQNGFPSAQNMTGGIQAWSEQVDAAVPQY